MRKYFSVIALLTTLATPVAFAQQADKADHGKMAAEEFASLDKNQDGKLSRAEVTGDKKLAEHFAMLDADKDGTLSQAEFAKHHQM